MRLNSRSQQNNIPYVQYTDIYISISEGNPIVKKIFFHARVELRRAGYYSPFHPVWKEFSTHVFGGSVSGDLLKLAADHLRPSLARFLALVPYPDHSHYERHHRDNTDQQRQCHDLATGRYYHRHFSPRVSSPIFRVTPTPPLGIVAKSVLSFNRTGVGRKTIDQ